MLALYLPVLKFELMGDDFLLAQLAHAARHDWKLLFSGLDSFYRPSTTWSFIIDWFVWGHHAGGYHFTNVLLRIGNTVLLFFALRRIRFTAVGAWIVAFLWACSPFSAEPVYTVGARIDELLTACWLVLVATWPRQEEAWSSSRLAVAGAALIVGILTKETWIVTVGLVLALELVQHGVGMRRALVSALPVAAFTALYLTLHLVLLPSGESYFTWSLAPLAKIPQEMGAFLYLEPFAPLASRASPLGALGCVIVAAIAVLVWKHDRVAGTVGTALLVLPQLPTLFVPYLPTRYTSIPDIGFLTLMVAGVQQLAAGLPRVFGRLAVAAGGALGLIVAGVGVLTVRADLDDMRGLSSWHARLLGEARLAAGSLPVGLPIVVIRAERENPLPELALSFHGLPKLFYPRHADAYALTDTSALFDWALEREDLAVRRCETPRDDPCRGMGRVLVHSNAGFKLDPQPVPDVASGVRSLRERGFRVRAIRVGKIN